MRIMSSAVDFAVHHQVIAFIVLFALFSLGTFVVAFARQPVSKEKAADWPVTEEQSSQSVK